MNSRQATPHTETPALPGARPLGSTDSTRPPTRLPDKLLTTMLPTHPLPEHVCALHALRLAPRHDPKLARPLYLGLKTAARLICDGEHGVIVSSEDRRQRIPLGRIDRIVLGPHASFTPEAIRRCLSAGVSFQHVDEGGETLGYAWGRRAVVPGRSSLLDRAGEDPEWWDVHYRAWLENIERAQVARALLGLGHSIQRCDAAHSRSVLAARFRLRHGEPAAALFDALDHSLRGVVSHALHINGWFSRPRPELTNRLIDDFTRVLAPTLYRAAVDTSLPGPVSQCLRNTTWLARFVIGNQLLNHDLAVIEHLLENTLRGRYG